MRIGRLAFAAWLAGGLAAWGAEPQNYGFSYNYTRNGLKVEITAGEGESFSNGTYVITVTPADAAVQRIVGQRDGVIRKAWVSDLNGDDEQEIVVFTMSATNGRGAVAVYEKAGKAEYSRRQMADLPEDLKKVFRGHDQFEVKNRVLLRIFALFNEGDPDSHPTGGVVRLRYAYAENVWVRE